MGVIPWSALGIVFTGPFAQRCRDIVTYALRLRIWREKYQKYFDSFHFFYDLNPLPTKTPKNEVTSAETAGKIVN